MHRFLPAFVDAAGFHVIEKPVDHRPRQHGLSNYGFRNRACYGLVDLFGMCWLFSHRHHLVETKIRIISTNTTSNSQALPPAVVSETP